MTFKKKDIPELITKALNEDFQKNLDDASDNEIYRAVSSVVNKILSEKRSEFKTDAISKGQKRIYYISMEFLMGRSLKTGIFNLGLKDTIEGFLKEKGINPEKIYEEEPDAGLGNGGLGRLAACFLDSMATLDKFSHGYSICYEYGIFKQKLREGWQTETPDNWLPGGDVWLNEKPHKTIQVRFDGHVNEIWDNGYHLVTHEGGTIVEAVPYDMYVSGYDSKSVSRLRLWKAKSPGLDMELFNCGNYVEAVSNQSKAEAISKILYPNDNHQAGKELRLRQQYFMSAASIGDIVNEHMDTYGTLENLGKKVAVHINDTHPTLAIPELMRILLDECGYSWDKAYSITCEVFAYTNHTVMKEALECWDEELFKRVLPRIHQIVCEIGKRCYNDIIAKTNDYFKAERMAIILNHSVRMANLCCFVSHSINGVSKLHSEIIKDEVFADFYSVYPEKFKNVTNGIAYRRWLLQSNTALTDFLEETIGAGFKKDASKLIKLRDFQNDQSVLDEMGKIKLINKQNFCKYVKNRYGFVLNENSIFDVQVKRLHEYKRQQMNALHIIYLFNKLMENPDYPMNPRTFIFAAKAAPGYYMAKQIIKLIYFISKEINKYPKIKEKLNVVFLEDYNVSLSEKLMPASEISEQISLAGTEASGTGNMKFMVNSAITLGTLDGANVEILDAVGDDNIVIFGMTADEVTKRRELGYAPISIYNNNEDVRKAIDLMDKSIGGESFSEIANSLKYSDYYMALADFESYKEAQKKIDALYSDKDTFHRMMLNNTAGAGVFSADRAISDYSRDIWHL